MGKTHRPCQFGTHLEPRQNGPQCPPVAITVLLAQSIPNLQGLAPAPPSQVNMTRLTREIFFYIQHSI